MVKKPVLQPQLGCSLDVVPTILGRDLLQGPPEANLALFNHNCDIGIYQNERLIVYGMGKGIEYYEGNPRIVDLKRLAKPGAARIRAERNGISLFQLADDLYINQRNRNDP